MISLKKDYKTTIDFLCYWFLFYVLCSSLGWLYETIDNFFQFGGLWLRAALLLPWCPIYGIGAIILVFGMRIIFNWINNFCNNKIIIGLVMFIVAFMISLIVELFGSYVCEYCFGVVPWDYSSYWLNFEGRTAPMFTIRFAFFGMIVFYLIKPWLHRIVEKHSQTCRFLSLVFLGLLIVDSIGEGFGAWDILEDRLIGFGVHHW